MYRPQDSLTNETSRPDRSGLTDADRAFMTIIAEREFKQGKISVEEYDYIMDRCRVTLGDTLQGFKAWLRSVVPFSSNRRTGTPRRPLTLRHA